MTTIDRSTRREKLGVRKIRGKRDSPEGGETNKNQKGGEGAKRGARRPINQEGGKGQKLSLSFFSVGISHQPEQILTQGHKSSSVTRHILQTKRQ